MQKKQKKRKSGGVRLPNGPPPAKKPRQARLPGLEDSAIKDLEDAAVEHSEKQSEIRALRAMVKIIDASIVRLMKENNKKTYNRAGIHLKLREGHDDVSVQVKRHDRANGEDLPKGGGELAEEQMPF